MSIIKIAEKAGVGISTVSRYINNPELVSTAAAARIAAAMEEIGYRLRVRRPGPKTRDRTGIKTGVILFMTIGHMSPEKLLQVPVMPMLLTGIQKSLMSHGLSMLFANSPDGIFIPELLSEKHCDGLIVQLLSVDHIADELSKKLNSMPLVWCFREHFDRNNESDHIFYNNEAVGIIAARYMEERKHQHVAYVNSGMAHRAYQQRGEIFIRNCTAAGITAESINSDLSEPQPIVLHARRLAEQIIKKNTGITGIFFCSDDTMLGVYNELRVNNYNLAEIDLLGCNNDSQALDHIHPRPATIDIRLNEIGEQAANRLLARINGSEHGPAMELLLNPRLLPAENNFETKKRV